ncbi:MAG: phenylalanine--tRNA ligase subunit alpha [Bacteroidia bacterium]
MDIQQEIEAIKNDIEKTQVKTIDQLESFRLEFLSKKGKIPALFQRFREVAEADRKEVGRVLNLLKQQAEEFFKTTKEQLEISSSDSTTDFDASAPGNPFPIGSRHPLRLVANQLYEVFSRIGFTLAEGPEIEDDWHNFSALNFPEEHPARDMQDTFFIMNDPAMALRTHTSSVQVRMMETRKPPLRMIMPGRVYRNEAISARAHCFFHQVEGIYIDKNVSFADLKQTMLYFSRELFGADTQIRLRPSYFPFTEPSAEMDISCTVCKGKGCNICKYTGWVEILGCGMIHPNVLSNSGIDPEEYTGFAFGMGIERIAILKYQVNDLRFFSQNDVRFLKQFTAQ